VSILSAIDKHACLPKMQIVVHMTM